MIEHPTIQEVAMPFAFHRVEPRFKNVAVWRRDRPKARERDLAPILIESVSPPETEHPENNLRDDYCRQVVRKHYKTAKTI